MEGSSGSLGHAVRHQRRHTSMSECDALAASIAALDHATLQINRMWMAEAAGLTAFVIGGCICMLVIAVWHTDIAYADDAPTPV